MYIVSQVLVGIGMVVDLTGKVVNKKRYFLLFLLVAGAFYTSSYLCLAQPMAAILNSIGVFRSIWYVILEKNNKSTRHYILPVVLFVIVAFVTFGLFFDGWIKIVLPISIVVASIVLVFSNMLYVRLGLIVNSLLWLIYNFTIKGYVNMLCDISTIVLLTISIVVYNILKIQNKQPHQDGLEVIGEQSSAVSNSSSTNFRTTTKED